MFRARPKKREPMGVRESPWVRCQGHLQWIRGRRCAFEGRPGHVCEGPIEAMHVRNGTDGAGAVKPSDFWTFPGCKIATHVPQTVEGEVAFEREHKISMKDIARDYARQSPHRSKWLSIGRDPEKEGTDRAPKNQWGKAAQ
jgi:hypothetical protein